MIKPWSTPILRWAGSKRKLVSTLMAYAPLNFDRYIEPFCGSACLFFALNPESAILGDINGELIHCYRILLKHPRLLYRLVQKMPNTKNDYLNYRKNNPSALNPLERAARFIYLNRYCFNGVYRTNRKGEFNVPRGTRTGALPSESLFYRSSYALRKALLISSDFEMCLDYAKKGDFVYLDPPYATSDKPKIEEYGPSSFQHADIKRLINALSIIEKKGVTFILSYADSNDLIDQINPAWSISRMLVRRHVAGFAKHREYVSEVLISNQQLM